MVRKSGSRDWSSPESYRPISLLPVAGKIFERILKQRLSNYLEENDLLSVHQYGFRPKRSAVQAIDLLKTTTINSTSTYVVTVLIDIRGAFDSLWWPEILRNLNRTGISKTMFGVLTSYLSNRTVTLQNDGESVIKAMSKGCPQGSVLGPLFWNITFDSLLNREFPIGVRPIALQITLHSSSKETLEDK